MRKISTDSYSSNESPRLSSPIKLTRSQRAGTMEIKMLNDDDIEEDEL